MENSNEQTPTQNELTIDLRKVREQDRVMRDIHEVYGQLYEQLGLSSLLPPSRYRASNRVLKEIVLPRLAQPASKRASVKLLTEQMGTRLQLPQVYRKMDQLNPPGLRNSIAWVRTLRLSCSNPRWMCNSLTASPCILSPLLPMN